MTAAQQKIMTGDCRALLATLPEKSFHCCVTSPPYYGLRDYGVDGQIGLEATLDGFIDEMRAVFRGVWEVLRDDGVLWLNLGDSYCTKPAANREVGTSSTLTNPGRQHRLHNGTSVDRPNENKQPGFKPKDLMGVPWRVAFALQRDGWYLRDDVIWHKPAPMPGSQQDRCTKAHEYLFQLTKSPRYFSDFDAIRESQVSEGRVPSTADVPKGDNQIPELRKAGVRRGAAPSVTLGGRMARSVWRIAAEPCSDAHFATFPTELPTRCIKASTSERGACEECGAPWERIVDREKLTRERPNELTKRSGEAGTGNHCANTVAGVAAVTKGWRPTCDCATEAVAPCRVLDPFNGAGTTGIACRRLGRDYVGIELNPEYVELSHKRWRKEANRGSKVARHESAEGQRDLFAEAAP